MAAYFEAAAQAGGNAKLASNWVMGELSRRINSGEADFATAPVSAAALPTDPADCRQHHLQQRGQAGV